MGPVSPRCTSERMLSSKEADMRADRDFFFSSGATQRFLVAGLLAVFVVLSAPWRHSADTAHAASRTSQVGDLRADGRLRHRAPSWLAATHFARPRFRPTLTVDVDTATEFWRAWNQLRPREEIDVHGVT